MQKAIISVIYHSQHGHTRHAAELLATSLESADTRVHCFSVKEAEGNWEPLHASDTLIFGCPTLFGTVSAGFKEFMEATGLFWYQQRWKNKLAAAFTVSATICGDKLSTLQTLSLFAAQHSMQWIPLGILPRFLNDEQTDGQNRLAAYLGLMIQTNSSRLKVGPLHPGDALTMELFARRIVEVTLRYKNLNINNHDTIRN
jgi:NAD(P)H dehydrogenase (quinone)